MTQHDHSKGVVCMGKEATEATRERVALVYKNGRAYKPHELSPAELKQVLAETSASRTYRVLPPGKYVVCERCGGSILEGDWPFCKGEPRDHWRA